MSTNITADQRAVFNALTSGKHDNFALFSCFVNGIPATAIVAVEWEGDEFSVAPLFVSLTPDMLLTDHDGVPCRVTLGMKLQCANRIASQIAALRQFFNLT